MDDCPFIYILCNLNFYFILFAAYGYAQIGNFRKAIDSFTKAISLDSTNKLATIKFLHKRAQIRYRYMLLAGALEDCTEIIKFRESIAPIADKYSTPLAKFLLLRARLYHKSKQYIKSIADYESALAMEPEERTHLKDLYDDLKKK